MRTEFERKVYELLETKKDRSILFNDERYKQLIEETKAAKHRKQNGLSIPSKYYRRLKRFDVITDGENEKLIHRIKGAGLKPVFFCPIGEFYDVLEATHIKLGHKREKAMEAELKLKYCNIIREVIRFYLDLCPICALKQDGRTNRRKVRFFIPFFKISRN